MKPKSERAELHNNYIQGFFNNPSSPEEQSNLENTNNPLMNNNHDLLLNKKIIKISPNSNSFSLNNNNNSVQLKTNILINDTKYW